MELPSMTGKTCVITGANTGIGRETALGLAGAGAHVVLACRSQERTQPVLDEINEQFGGDTATFVELDLASLDSVRRAVTELQERMDSIDVLINNAGIGGGRGETEDGFEQHFGINHLGHFLLTTELLDLLRESSDARIINVSSQMHRRADGIDFDAVTEPTASATGIPEYGVSKLANVLFTAELDRRPECDGISTYAVHPGTVSSDIWRSVPFFVRPFIKFFMISPAEGAKTSLYCACKESAAEKTGLYWNECQPQRPSRQAQDEQLAAQLWQKSQDWVS